MRVRTVIQIDKSDFTRLEEMDVALNLVGLGQITREYQAERGEAKPPLVAAIGALRGNAFTLQDLDVIVRGIERRAAEVSEVKEVFTDPKMNETFYNGVQANARRAVEKAHAFRERLREEMLECC